MEAGSFFGHVSPEGRVVSASAVFAYGSRLSSLGLVMVDPEWRRRGLATEAVRHCMGICAPWSSSGHGLGKSRSPGPKPALCPCRSGIRVTEVAGGHDNTRPLRVKERVLSFEGSVSLRTLGVCSCFPGSY
ncbi:GNAT family N-acetyltransferase [Staphylospora marina]|uniref:GNAT family N-acetyltransferase n=1 Tax=Staphylospora marina TaxID=2490858 RepID=UPI003B969463